MVFIIGCQRMIPAGSGCIRRRYHTDRGPVPSPSGMSRASARSLRSRRVSGPSVRTRSKSASLSPLESGTFRYNRRGSIPLSPSSPDSTAGSPDLTALTSDTVGTQADRKGDSRGRRSRVVTPWAEWRRIGHDPRIPAASGAACSTAWPSVIGRAGGDPELPAWAMPDRGVVKGGRFRTMEHIRDTGHEARQERQPIP